MVAAIAIAITIAVTVAAIASIMVEVYVVVAIERVANTGAVPIVLVELVEVVVIVVPMRCVAPAAIGRKVVIAAIVYDRLIRMVTMIAPAAGITAVIGPTSVAMISPVAAA